MNTELKEAILALEKEKKISSETLFSAIENALITACKSHFGKAENIKVNIDRDSFTYSCCAEKTVVETPEEVEDSLEQISLEDAAKIQKTAQEISSAWRSTAEISAGSPPRSRKM